MKQIYTAKHAMDAYLVKGFLDSNGIEAVVRGEHLGGGWGELPVDLCTVWVANDREYERANSLLVAFLTGAYAAEMRADRWQCPHCHENLEGQFTTCWNCGTRRPDAGVRNAQNP